MSDWNERMEIARSAPDQREFCRSLPWLNPKQKGMCRQYFTIFSAVFYAARYTLCAPLCSALPYCSLFTRAGRAVHCSLLHFAPCAQPCATRRSRTGASTVTSQTRCSARAA